MTVIGVDGERRTYNLFEEAVQLDGFRIADEGVADDMLEGATVTLARLVKPDGYLEDAWQGTRILWLPAVGRAAALCGGDPVWTDAESEEDACRRLLSGDIIE